jgi:amino acid transporter
MFILGTSSVLAFVGQHPINIIGPIPQTFRIAFGGGGWAAFGICLILARAIAGASLIFTGLTRLPMAAGWDNLAPRWFTELHPRWRTPVNSILALAATVMALILLSMLGVREQEANQLLAASSVAHYAIAYIALFALPLIGKAALRAALPTWLKVAAALGLIGSLISLFIAVYPIVDVVSPAVYAGKICAVVTIANGVGVLLYRYGKSR